MTAQRAARRAGLIWGPFVAATIAALSREVRSWEHEGTRQLNRLPDALNAPLWTVMQAGSFGAPLVAAAAAIASGCPEFGGRLAGSGLSAYFLAKAVKRSVRRGRPSGLVAGLRVRGRPASGDGFVSGHAAVSMALACEAYQSVGASVWPLPVLVAPLVGTARVYVGAHLPLDVLGGAALGWAVSRSIAVIRSSPATRAGKLRT
jgi:membrane-associated phospholipid phosphatase